MTKLFHPLLALIASASDSLLRRQVRYLKEENQILRARIPGQVQTRAEERERLLKSSTKPATPTARNLIRLNSQPMHKTYDLMAVAMEAGSLKYLFCGAIRTATAKLARKSSGDRGSVSSGLTKTRTVLSNQMS